MFKDKELKRNNPIRSLNELLLIPYKNNFEFIIRKKFKEVEQLFLWMLKYAPSYLTGTGSCVFSEFNSENNARNVLKKAPTWCNCFVAKGVNISPLNYIKK